MEYLKVIVADGTGQDIDVLINRERTGRTGDLLTLSRGIVLVSVDLPNAEEKRVDLCGTTPSYPKVVVIRVRTYEDQPCRRLPDMGHQREKQSPA